MSHDIRRVALALGLGMAFVAAACTSGAANPSASIGADPSAVGATNGLEIRYDEQAQFELSLPDGRRVYIDVRDPSLLEKQPQAGDVLLVTGEAAHHIDPSFADAFPGQMLMNEPGTIELDGLRAVSIDSSALDQPVDHQYPGNQILLIEAAGLRIVACGDLDQAELDAEQMAALGAVDVALCPIAYAGGGSADSGERARAVIGQLRARLIVPTHSSIEAATEAVALWHGSYVAGPAISVTRETLPASPSIVFLGDLAPSFGTILSLPQFTSR